MLKKIQLSYFECLKGNIFNLFLNKTFAENYCIQNYVFEGKTFKFISKLLVKIYCKKEIFNGIFFVLRQILFSKATTLNVF